jgi:hypothetical protein
MTTTEPTKRHFRPGDRMYTSMWALIQLNASVISSSLMASRGVVTTEAWTAAHQSKLLGTVLMLPVQGVVEHSISDRLPRSIAIKIGEPGWINPPPDGGGKSQFSALLELVASVIFVNFIERYQHWTKTKYSQDLTKWPPVINFARLIRNACSHSGKLTFAKPTSFGGSWHGLTYSAGDDGRRVIGVDLFFPEIVILMLEVGDELDRAGAPVID